LSSIIQNKNLSLDYKKRVLFRIEH